MINVTKTFLPPQDEYHAILKQAWDSGWITNRGVLVQELETKLQSFLGVNHLIAMTNGTLPLQVAIKALKLKGEIITTPFSYVATTSSIVWENCTPVFVDIDPDYLTIDETKIEAAITPKTSAILATHVFGNPCDVHAIQNIAKKHNLKVIYDAAHCFGVQYKGQSIFNYGDVSTCSFHATKVFHTGEGGCCITNSEELFKQLFYYHNFGHDGPGKFYDVGINAKMSELQAAMGLAVYPYLDSIFNERKRVVELYNKEFKNTNFKSIIIREDTIWNYSYYPIILNDEETLLNLVLKLEEHQVFTRRYFYPSLNTLNYLELQKMPISEDVSKRILCLPLYLDLSNEDVFNITSIIKTVVNA